MAGQDIKAAGPASKRLQEMRHEGAGHSAPQDRQVRVPRSKQRARPKRESSVVARQERAPHSERRAKPKRESSVMAAKFCCTK